MLLGTRLKRLSEALQMGTHNIRFCGEIRKHLPGYPSALSLLKWSLWFFTQKTAWNLLHLKFIFDINLNKVFFFHKQETYPDILSAATKIQQIKC